MTSLARHNIADHTNMADDDTDQYQSAREDENEDTDNEIEPEPLRRAWNMFPPLEGRVDPQLLEIWNGLGAPQLRVGSNEIEYERPSRPWRNLFLPLGHT